MLADNVDNCGHECGRQPAKMRRQQGRACAQAVEKRPETLATRYVKLALVL